VSLSTVKSSQTSPISAHPTEPESKVGRSSYQTQLPTRKNPRFLRLCFCLLVHENSIIYSTTSVEFLRHRSSKSRFPSATHIPDRRVVLKARLAGRPELQRNDQQAPLRPACGRPKLHPLSMNRATAASAFWFDNSV
jgi:hypothetical protein